MIPTARRALLLVGVLSSLAMGWEASARPGEEATAPVSRRLTVERVLVLGNRRVDDETILRYLRLGAGAPLTVDVLEEARARLLVTGYFTDVELLTSPGSERGTVVLAVHVVERNPVSVETGFGYDTLYGWFVTLVGLRVDHALGVESQFKLGLRLGYRLSGIDAAWEKPVAPEGGFGLGIRLHAYGQEHLFYAAPSGLGPGGLPSAGATGEPWVQFRQDLARAGGEVGLHVGPGGPTLFTLGAQAEVVEPEGTFRTEEGDTSFTAGDFPPEMRADLDRTLITGVFLRILRDSRDSGSYPRSGSLLLLELESNGGFLGGDESFSKATLDARIHVGLGGGTVLSTRAAAGVVSPGAPYYERFYLGGNYSIRGFREWSLSRTQGDDGYWLTNLELRVPLTRSRSPQPRLTGLLFADAGQGWRRDGPGAASRVEAGVGYGVRLRLPWLGTLGLDAGIPITEGRTGDRFRGHVLLGFSF